MPISRYPILNANWLPPRKKESVILTDSEIRHPPEKKSSFLWDGKTYPIHPFCDLFPWMNDEDQASLRDDVAENGLLVPILLYQGQVLDWETPIPGVLGRGRRTTLRGI